MLPIACETGTQSIPRFATSRKKSYPECDNYLSAAYSACFQRALSMVQKILVL